MRGDNWMRARVVPARRKRDIINNHTTELERRRHQKPPPNDLSQPPVERSYTVVVESRSSCSRCFVILAN